MTHISTPNCLLCRWGDSCVLRFPVQGDLAKAQLLCSRLKRVRPGSSPNGSHRRQCSGNPCKTSARARSVAHFVSSLRRRRYETSRQSCRYRVCPCKRQHSERSCVVNQYSSSHYRSQTEESASPESQTPRATR